MGDQFARTLSEAKVGDLLHVFDVNRDNLVDGVRRGRGKFLNEPYRVTKIGRNYLHCTCDGWAHVLRFNRETGHGASERGYSSSYRAYGSDDKTAHELRETLDVYRLTQHVMSAPRPQLLAIISALGKTVADYQKKESA